MNKREAVIFLFAIAQEIQHSFVSPVILFTLKDYAKGIFECLVDIRQALLENATPKRISETVCSFHIKWLEAIQDVEKFKKRVKETPRDMILKAIDYTIECTQERFTHLRKYIVTKQSSMTDEELKLMQADLEVIKEMQDILNSALIDKQQYIRSQADQTEYHVRIHDEIEELMNWLDGLNNSLAVQFCKVLNFKIPLSPSDLTKPLKQIIDEVAADPTPEAQRVAELISIKGRILGSKVRSSSVNELEIVKVVEKIEALEARISRLQSENSSALLALKHKTMFLEERLQSLENLKLAMKTLKRDSAAVEQGDNAENIYDHKETRIFNHLLPHHDRCRLVEQLIQLWNSAIIEHDHESIISILSVADLKEIFSDEKGNFTVDKYGRKIYSKENDSILYQLNEHNELVPVEDDEKHVYFYDACGRYYINGTRERIYKRHDGASEYVLNKCGYLVKVLEEIDGVEFYFDWLGRYYINDEGQHIYCEENSSEEYEHDGLGNLVKIHTEPFYYEPCPTEPMTMEENNYLKEVVGEALKKCVAEVVVHQPTDPIAYLADRLSKYGDNVKEHQRRLNDEQERIAQSQLLHTTRENSLKNLFYVDEDEGDDDFNFINYEHDTDHSF